MDKLQLLGFFALGFFLSRAVVAAELPRQLVSRLQADRNKSGARLTFEILLLASLLSLFIPNSVTALALLPVIDLLKERFSLCPQSSPGSPPEAAIGTHRKEIATSLGLATIYGSNIGGIGSITATPANAIFAFFCEANEIPGTERIQFLPWLAWGVPLATILSLLSWAILTLRYRLWRFAPVPRIEEPLDRKRAWSRHAEILLALSASYFLLATLLSFAMLRASEDKQGTVVALSLSLCALAILSLFMVPLRLDRRDNGSANMRVPARKKPLLRPRDCLRDLPWKGLSLFLLVVCLGAVLLGLRVDRALPRLAVAVLPRTIQPLPFFVTTALFCSFATEILSNTVVQIGLFLASGYVATISQIPRLRSLLVITLSSTCAFMSPVATGVNGLVYGGLSDMSLKDMIVSGFMVNIAVAIVISLWVWSVVWW